MTPTPHGRASVKLQLKGLHKVKRALSGGGHSVHYYAWRGGPRIDAQPGTPAFVEAWQALTAARDKAPATGTLQDLITGYQGTPLFTGLAAETRKGYVRCIRAIEAEFGDLPIKALADPRIRGDFLDWRDRIAARSLRQADYHFSVLARIISWAHDRRRIPSNPCERPGRLYKGSRSGSVWTDAEIAAFDAVARPHVALPAIIARNTGQRQADILALTWAAYDGQALNLRQAKGGRFVRIPVAADLRTALDAARARRGAAVTICTNSRGQPWTADGYKTSFGKAKGAIPRTFHDFRGTAVTRLALAGCTVPEIATITGHSLKDVETMLDRHYLNRDKALGESAIAKLDRHRERTGPVNGPVNGSEGKPSARS